MSLTYTTFVQQLFNMVAALSTANGSSATDSSWNTELPGIIDYAEQRCYRDLDLLATRYTDTSTLCSTAARTVALSTATTTFLVVEAVNLGAPSSLGSSAFNLGSRIQVTPSSRQFIDFAWGASSSGTGAAPTGPPEFFAMKDNATLLFGPAPDLPYPIEVVGTGRPTVLSSGNSSTILTTMLPDLFMSAAMIKASAFMRDFGSQADNPQMAASWEGQYKTLLQSAEVEEFRKKHEHDGWTNRITPLNAKPARGG